MAFENESRKVAYEACCAPMRYCLLRFSTRMIGFIALGFEIRVGDFRMLRVIYALTSCLSIYRHYLDDCFNSVCIHIDELVCRK